MLIDFHTHKKESGDINLFNAFLEPYDLPCSFGIHPWYINTTFQEDLITLKERVQQENCYAVGECGLDKNSEVPFPVQETCFRAQVELSEWIQKPLIIHCVKAIQELIQIKREIQPKQPWIFHGFRKTNTLQQLLNEGFYISIGTAIVYDKKLQEILPEIPLNKLFLETDDKENPIEEVYAKVAEIVGINQVDLENQIQENFKLIMG